MINITKITILLAFGACAFICGQAHGKTNASKPNIVVIFADDMGYGDMSNNGNPVLRTPNLDQMALEGQKWTNFYVTAPVCSPSRAGLMLGRYPVRAGLASSTPMRKVFREDSLGGMPQEELTIAEALKQQGYRTAMIGKWHIGHQPEYLPHRHGFDSWFGVPYSNDMNLNLEKVKEVNGPAWSRASWGQGKHWEEPKSEYWNIPLMHNDEVLEVSPNQHLLTKRYTDKAVNYIKSNKTNPFFLYIAHAMPHVPLFASEEFEGRSTQGRYGDVIEELDWSVGQILQTLKDEGIAENTLVVFSSDNGPWTYFKTLGGSAGLLRGGKSDVFEGGMRVPGIFWWPTHIKPALVHDIGSTLDLLPTSVALAGGDIPENLDGVSLADTLLHEQKVARDTYFYYRGANVFAVRKGRYKAHFIFKEGFGVEPVLLDEPLLFDLHADPSEKYNIAKKHPEVLAQLAAIRQQHLETVEPVENQLDKCRPESPICRAK